MDRTLQFQLRLVQFRIQKCFIMYGMHLSVGDVLTLTVSEKNNDTMETQIIRSLNI